MTDMLVRLYELPAASAANERLGAERVSIKRALAMDTGKVLAFVDGEFGERAPGWVDECHATLLRQPATCFIADRAGEVLGFACFDATARGMFGPTGVARSVRARGIGRALLIASLQAMSAAGYAYAVIGWVQSEDYYRKAVGAMPIPDSEPGFYRHSLGR